MDFSGRCAGLSMRDDHVELVVDAVGEHSP